MSLLYASIPLSLFGVRDMIYFAVVFTSHIDACVTVCLLVICAIRCTPDSEVYVGIGTSFLLGFRLATSKFNIQVWSGYPEKVILDVVLKRHIVIVTRSVSSQDGHHKLLNVMRLDLVHQLLSSVFQISSVLGACIMLLISITAQFHKCCSSSYACKYAIRTWAVCKVQYK